MAADSTSRYDQKLVFVLKTSAAIFAEKGYHSTSIRDIARATQMSLSGLYYYFRSKEELLYLIQDYCFTTVLGECRAAIAGTDDPVQQIRLLIENHLHFFVNNMNEMKVLSHEANSIGGDFFAKVNARKREYVDTAMDLVRRIGEERGVEDVDVRVATFSLFGMMNWIYNWYDPGRDVDVTGLSENVARLFLTGYLGNKGRKADRLQAGRKPHPGRTVSVWQQ